MMKQEFEKLAGRMVTMDQWNMIEGLYMESDLEKHDFVKSIKGLLKSIPEEHSKQIKVMCKRNKWGENTTPNGCWYMTVLVEVMDVDIKTGKIKVREIPNSFELRYNYELDCWNKAIEIVA